ncbi:MAG: hypothetical protein U1E77_10055 [Inhella sp.]
MRTNLNAAVGLFASFALSGCMTFVEGKKDTSADGEGVEYSLPVPVLRVTPMPDGSIDVQVEMLADPDNTYRLKTKSYLSSYTLDVVRENGMLKSVSLDAKSDAVAAAVLDAKANLIKAKAAAEEKDREAAASAAKDQAKAISDAKMEGVLADAKLMALQADPDADRADVAAAKLAKAVADAKLAALQAAATDSGKSGFNVAKEKLAPAAREGARISAAPVLFRVIPDPDRNTVRLVAFEGDRFLETSVAARRPEEPATVPPLELRLDDGGVLKKGKPLVMKLVANKPNLSVDLAKTGVTQMGAGDKLLPYVLLANPQPDDGSKSKTTFLVTLKDTVPPGSYNLVLRMLKPVVDPKDGPEPLIADPIPFVVNK